MVILWSKVLEYKIIGGLVLFLLLTAAVAAADALAGESREDAGTDAAAASERRIAASEEDNATVQQQSNETAPEQEESMLSSSALSSNSSGEQQENSSADSAPSAAASSISLSAVANPTGGVAPFQVQFTAVATGLTPVSYSWDFNNDGIVDSTSQNPSYTYNAAGNYTASVLAVDAAGGRAREEIPLLVTAYDSQLSLDSYFPLEFNQGAAQITFIVANTGTEPVSNVAARIVGNGVEYLTSTTLARLNPGDKDTITVKVNILKSGTLSATAKVLDKNFPIILNVTQQVEYDKISMSAELAALKQQLDEQEKTYYDKKADGYLVSEMADQIKDLKEQVLETEQQLFTGKLADASVGLYIGKSAISDLSNDLQSATKLKVTPLQWLKENAVAIAAIIAAFGTISGLLIKAKHKAAKAAEQAGKFGKEMAQKKWFGKKGEVKDQPAASPPVEEEAGGNPLIDEEKESKD